MAQDGEANGGDQIVCHTGAQAGNKSAGGARITRSAHFPQLNVAHCGFGRRIEQLAVDIPERLAGSVGDKCGTAFGVMATRNVGPARSRKRRHRALAF